MREVGAFEAKTRLGQLLDWVEAGEEVVITRRGKVVARMVRPDMAFRPRARPAGRGAYPRDAERRDARRAFDQTTSSARAACEPGARRLAHPDLVLR